MVLGADRDRFEVGLESETIKSSNWILSLNFHVLDLNMWPTRRCPRTGNARAAHIASGTNLRVEYSAEAASIVLLCLS